MRQRQPPAAYWFQLALQAIHFMENNTSKVQFLSLNASNYSPGLVSSHKDSFLVLFTQHFKIFIYNISAFKA